jgi:VWFA-related protein
MRPLPLLLAFALATAQEQPPEPTIRITVTRVQVDAIVTDRQGRAVPNLTAGDFEILQDGKPVPIKSCNFVSLLQPTAVPREFRPNIPGPNRPVDRSQVRRTLAIVVDDLGLSWESMAYLRDSLKNFVTKQLQPGDFVTIMRTSAGAGAFQQFTSDRAQLLATVDRLKWYPLSRSGAYAVAPIESDTEAGNETADERALREGRQRAAENELLDIFSSGTLGALRYLITGLREVPGRKSVVLFSDSLPLVRRGREGFDEVQGRTIEAMRSLVDIANRNFVVLYTMDGRGLQPLNISAADSTFGRTPDQMEAKSEERRINFQRDQDGLAYLAHETGGVFLANQNDLGRIAEQAMADQNGYYVLTYQPPDSTFELKARERFHRVRVRVRRAGLTVRTRSGFLGVPDREGAPRPPADPNQQLVHAMLSPFASADVRIRLTALFDHTKENGTFLDAVVHIDGRDLTFNDEPDGRRKATVDILVATFDEKGFATKDTNMTFNITAIREALERDKKLGFVYTVRHKVPKAGAYQFRVAVRDRFSSRTGSASQFVQIPDFNKNRLALSSLALATQEKNTDGVLALRRFHPNEEVAYRVRVFHPQGELERKMSLYRDGKPVYQGPPQRWKPEVQPAAMFASGMKLGSNLAPGDYVMQVEFRDPAKPKSAPVVQWTDFEVLPRETPPVKP